MDGVPGALLAGLLAGLGVAMPLGAVGVLLLQEGIARGWRPAAAGATGVALVDLGYAVTAVVAGVAVAGAVSGHERQVRTVGAVLLGLVVVHGLLALRRPVADPAAVSPPGTHVLLRFVGLTAVNPTTAVYFVVLTTGLGDGVRGPARGAAFVAGVFVASCGWQLLLAAAGAAAGTRLPGWARTAVSLVGYGVVCGYAVTLALP